MSYIVKNCPCHWHIVEDDGCSLENMKSCKDCTDCVMKQIVELCKKAMSSRTMVYLPTDILQLLDIQEIE